MAPAIKAFLFDFDGTLVDTMGGFADIAGRIIHENHPGVPFETARQRYLDTSGVPFFQQLEIIFPDDPGNAKMAADFEEAKQTGFFSQKFHDDVIHTINTIRSRGVIAGVCSNNFQELIDKFVEREGLEFDIVLGFRQGFEKGKAHFDFVMRKFKLKPGELVFVGDSLKDADKARMNNLRFVGLCGTFTAEDFRRQDPATATINNIKELLDL